MNVLERLKKTCKEKGTTITRLCLDATGNSGNLATWKNNNGHMRSDYLLRCAEILGVTTDYLLGRTDIETASLSEQDINLLKAYHEKTEMQEAVNRLLSLTSDDNITPIQKTQKETIVVNKAAFGGGTEQEKITEDEASKREKAIKDMLAKFPSIDD